MREGGWTRDDLTALFDQEPERGAVRRALDVALTGWGYDYHNPAAKLRENDAVVRRLASASLTEAANRATALEAEYKRERVPPISREAPYPTLEAKAAMGRARRIAEDARALASRIDTLETPGSDSVSRRLRDERTTLADLVDADMRLVFAAQAIATAVARLDIDALETPERTGTVASLLTEFASAIAARGADIAS